jgi:hypothetical protein
MLTVSLLVATAAFAGPSLTAVRFWSATAYYRFDALFVLVLPAIWLGLVLIAFFRYRLRGLWFLTGLPLAMCWPVIYAVLFWACAHGDCP